MVILASVVVVVVVARLRHRVLRHRIEGTKPFSTHD